MRSSVWRCMHFYVVYYLMILNMCVTRFKVQACVAGSNVFSVRRYEWISKNDRLEMLFFCVISLTRWAYFCNGFKKVVVTVD